MEPQHNGRVRLWGCAMLLAALLMSSATVSCPTVGETIAVAITPISGEALGGERVPDAPDVRLSDERNADARAAYRIGYFGYRGHGVASTSTDPEFVALTLSQHGGLLNRCGNQVSAPSGWNARDDAAWPGSLRIEPIKSTQQPSPGSVAADKRGARPVLSGYTSGASWPIGGFFLGLMHPVDGTSRTLIVAFPDVAAASPAMEVADLPLALETINVVPNHHGTDSGINLSGLSNGELIHIVLRIDQDAGRAIGAKLRSLSEPRS